MRARTAERIRDMWEVESFHMSPSETRLWNAMLRAGGYDERVEPGSDDEAEEAEIVRIEAMLRGEE